MRTRIVNQWIRDLRENDGLSDTEIIASGLKYIEYLEERGHADAAVAIVWDLEMAGLLPHA